MTSSVYNGDHNEDMFNFMHVIHSRHLSGPSIVCIALLSAEVQFMWENALLLPLYRSELVNDNVDPCPSHVHVPSSLTQKKKEML